MCLIIDHTMSKPRRGNIRYKFIVRERNGTLHSPSKRFTWERGNTVNVCRSNRIDATDVEEQAGFHVFTNRKDAKRASYHWSVCNLGSIYVIVKLKVNKFRYAGTIMGCDPYSDGKYGEIWSEATILEVTPIK